MMKPTYSKDGFLFFKELQNNPQSILGDRLIIDPSKIESTIKYAKKNGIKSITINPSYYQVENLNFLYHFYFIEGLYLLQMNLDLAPIERLVNLRALTINSPYPNIDFRDLINMEVLGISYSKNVQNLNSCTKLFWLWLDSYRNSDLIALETLTKLRYLNLYKTGILDLFGIENLTKLESLKIDTAAKLKTLYGLSKKNTFLKTIDIYGAKNLRDYSAIENAISLENIWITKTGDLPSINFLRSLKNVRNVAVGSKVIDGDMSFLKSIEVVNFKDYPHYNLKMKDLKK